MKISVNLDGERTFYKHYKTKHLIKNTSFGSTKYNRLFICFSLWDLILAGSNRSISIAQGITYTLLGETLKWFIK